MATREEIEEKLNKAKKEVARLEVMLNAASTENCAWCGSEAMSVLGPGFFQVQCTACNMRGPIAGIEAKSIDAWNAIRRRVVFHGPWTEDE